MIGLIGLGLVRSEIGKYLVRVGLLSSAGAAAAAATDPSVAGGRLTASSTEPVTTSDTTSATLYYLPYIGNKLAVYDGAAWGLVTIPDAGATLDVSALTTAQVYDVFGYSSGGTLTLEAVAWSNHGAGTGARATALTRVGGVLVKSGDTGKRYLGTIRTITSTGVKCQDSLHFRFIWNAANRVPVRDYAGTTTDSWTVSSTNGTFGAINSGNATWKYDFVVGLDSYVESIVSIFMFRDTGQDSPIYSVALNGTSPSGTIATRHIASIVGATAFPSLSLINLMPVGYNYTQGVETTSASGTAPISYGDGGSTAIQSGMTYSAER